MNKSYLREQVRAIAPWATELRRELHRIPEKGFQEYKSALLQRKVLHDLGIDYVTGRTWTIATIRGAHPGETVALRADIDALPVVEPQGCPFRSKHEGYMHACGHDVHTAILLGAAKLLQEHRDELYGNVRLLFQPAEETEGGALPMVKAGAMLNVSHVFGLHVQPYMLVGDIDTRYGMLNASTDDVELIVHGVSSHAARPNQGVDAIACAGQLLVALQSITSRSISPVSNGVLSLGIIEGGQAGNIVCDRVRIKGTLRAGDPKTRSAMINRIYEICYGVGAAYGAQIDVNIDEGYCPLINNDKEVDRVLRVGRELLGDDHVHLRPQPSMGGEDFAFFCREAPGAFWHLGCATTLPAPTLHSADFVPDERCIPIGIAMHAAIVLDILG